METNAQHRPQPGEVNGAGRDRDGRDRRLRIAVAVLSVLLSGLFVMLFSDTFEHGMAVAILFTASAWVPAMYSLALFALTNPIYWWMHSFAAYLAVWQLFTKPFYWEKTDHALTDVADIDGAISEARLKLVRSDGQRPRHANLPGGAEALS